MPHLFLLQKEALRSENVNIVIKYREDKGKDISKNFKDQFSNPRMHWDAARLGKLSYETKKKEKSHCQNFKLNLCHNKNSKHSENSENQSKPN